MAQFFAAALVRLVKNRYHIFAGNDADLSIALNEGMIAGAGFDVTTPSEPPVDANPLLPLLNMPNFVRTPHVAWASHESKKTLADRLIDNIEAFVADEPANVVSGSF